MFDIEKIIELLKEERTIFHSEDDLKLCFGMIIQTKCSNCQVRLERPVDIEMVNIDNSKKTVSAPIDVIIIENDKNIIPIELKYKTKEIKLNCNNEIYKLKHHGALEIARYNFRKDIYRIEQFLLSNENCTSGYVLILSNENSYFDNDVSKKENFDKDLSFHDGAKVNKIYAGWYYGNINKEKYTLCEETKIWYCINQSKKHWTFSKELIYKLDFKSNYNIKWNIYSKFEETEFKYCLIEIKKQKSTNA